MAFTDSIYFTPLIIGPILIIAGWLIMTFPPKKINYWYGYRTRASMKSQQRWNFAQTYSGYWMTIWGAVMGAGAGLGYLLAPEILKGKFWVGLLVMLFFVAIPIIQTERQLRKFD